MSFFVSRAVRSRSLARADVFARGDVAVLVASVAVHADSILDRVRAAVLDASFDLGDVQKWRAVVGDDALVVALAPNSLVAAGTGDAWIVHDSLVRVTEGVHPALEGRLVVTAGGVDEEDVVAFASNERFGRVADLLVGHSSYAAAVLVAEK